MVEQMEQLQAKVNSLWKIYVLVLRRVIPENNCTMSIHSKQRTYTSAMKAHSGVNTFSKS